MVRRQKLLIASGSALLAVGIIFGVRTHRQAQPYIPIPSGYKLIHVDQPMSTLELAAFSRHQRFAATAPRWVYMGPGNSNDMADQVEKILKKQGKWTRVKGGDMTLFIEASRSGALVKVTPTYHYGPNRNESAIEVMGPLQKPGLLEKTLAFFPIDKFSPSK